MRESRKRILETHLSNGAKAAPLLRLEAVEALIDRYHILHGVDFVIEAGSSVAMLGRNGVGKTTTLKAILNAVSETRGSIYFGGRDITSLSTHEIVRCGIAYVPEDRGLFPFLTVEENLRVPVSDSRAWDYVLELFPVLKDRMRQTAGLLSGGQQQMLSIARALIQEPELLLLDEPSQGLAPLIVEELVERLRSLSGRTTILLVEQNLDVAKRLCDSFVIIDDGKSVLTGATAHMDGMSAEIERYLSVAGG